MLNLSRVVIVTVALFCLLPAVGSAQLAWTQLAPITSPNARSGHKLAYHPGRQRTVLFGGQNGATYFDDTWEFDGTTWRQVPLALRPPARAWHSLAYDAARDALLLFGGGDRQQLFADVWVYSAQGRWSVLATSGTGPSARLGHAAFWLPAAESLVVFGGSSGVSGLGDQWQLDRFGQWRRALSALPARTFGSIAFDSDRGVAVASGGIFNGSLLADTWEMRAGVWRPSTNNLAIAGIDMVYDPVRQRVVSFGGMTSAASLTANHGEYALGTWSLFGIARPPARIDAAMTFDANLGKVLMFGGTGATGPLADTWQLGSRIDAEVELFGAPCGAVPPVLEPGESGERPWIGSDFRLRLRNLPNQGIAVLFVGASSQVWQGLPLPVGLSLLGLPACQVHVSLDVALDLGQISTEALATLSIPPALALNGGEFFAQAVVLDGQGFPVGLRLSNAARMKMGLR